MGMDLTAIRNVYCVGRNYAAHARELGNEVPESPVVFLKPSHAVGLLDGSTVRLPGDRGEVHYELELVVRIDRPYEPDADPESMVGGLALGIDWTLRDVQSVCKAKGLPWLDAKAFPSAALITEWQPYPGLEALSRTPFALMRDGEQLQLGQADRMLFPIPRLIAHIGARFGLGPGDLIFTGTPEGVGAVRDGDRLECLLDGRAIGGCTVRLG